MPPRALSRYRVNLARHLIGISRDLQGRAGRALAEDEGFSDLRPSFAPLLALLSDAGRPLAALARELAISGQAASQLAGLVEAAGYAERLPNPEDRRSRLLVLTPRGRDLVGAGIRILLETESEYAALVGPTAYRRFTGSLAKLDQGLGRELRREHGREHGREHRRQSLGVLPNLADWIQRQLMEANRARGHAGLKLSHGQVLPLIGPDGGRVASMARIQGVSRQAISATTRDLEELGYLQREPDPRDGRGVVFTLTRRGERLIADSIAALDDLDVSFREILGPRSWDDLERVARDLYDALGLETEVFGAAVEREDIAREDIAREGKDIKQLAVRLRRWLGERDSERLAAALETRATRSITRSATRRTT